MISSKRSILSEILYVSESFGNTDSHSNEKYEEAKDREERPQLIGVIDTKRHPDVHSEHATD